MIIRGIKLIILDIVSVIMIFILLPINPEQTSLFLRILISQFIVLAIIPAIYTLVKIFKKKEK